MIIGIILALIMGTAAGALLMLIKVRQLEKELFAVRLQHVQEKEAFQAKSRAVNKGLISQEMVPMMKAFPYAFKDARRAVHPLDYIVFDGLSDNELREIIFLEIKTGVSNSMTTNERQIKKAVDEGRVRYQIFNPDYLDVALDSEGSNCYNGS
jgi:predicted Holliday junction resolvase-like endonuclease